MSGTAKVYLSCISRQISIMPGDVKSRQVFLGQRSIAYADATLVADAAVSVWKEIYTVLEPIFGHGGVTALFKRSLSLGRMSYPVLVPFDERATLLDAVDVLHGLLVKQTAKDAAAIHNELLFIFYGLMTSLIGESLCQRLLRAVFETSSNGNAVQDILL